MGLFTKRQKTYHDLLPALQHCSARTENLFKKALSDMDFRHVLKTDAEFRTMMDEHRIREGRAVQNWELSGSEEDYKLVLGLRSFGICFLEIFKLRESLKSAGWKAP